MADELSNPWKTLQKRLIYDNRWIRVEEHDVINPGGKEALYGIVQFKHFAIGIVPLDADGNIYLVGQHRYPFGKYTWEIPEGGGNIHEEPLVNAKRELLEETGLRAARWERILDMQISNSVTDELGIIYLATELTQDIPCPEEDEDITVRKVPFDDAYHMIEKKEILDSLTVAAILKCKLMMQQHLL